MRQPDEAVLLDMLLFARRIGEVVADRTRADFDSDDTIQFALTHLIRLIGRAANKSTAQLRSAYSEVPWHEIIGMGHRIVHDYQHVQIALVWQTAIDDVPPLVAILEAILPKEPPA